MLIYSINIEMLNLNKDIQFKPLIKFINRMIEKKVKNSKDKRFLLLIFYSCLIKYCVLSNGSLNYMIILIKQLLSIFAGFEYDLTDQYLCLNQLNQLSKIQRLFIFYTSLQIISKTSNQSMEPIIKALTYDCCKGKPISNLEKNKEIQFNIHQKQHRLLTISQIRKNFINNSVNHQIQSTTKKNRQNQLLIKDKPKIQFNHEDRSFYIKSRKQSISVISGKKYEKLKSKLPTKSLHFTILEQKNLNQKIKSNLPQNSCIFLGANKIKSGLHPKIKLNKSSFQNFNLSQKPNPSSNQQIFLQNPLNLPQKSQYQESFMKIALSTPSDNQRNRQTTPSTSLYNKKLANSSYCDYQQNSTMQNSELYWIYRQLEQTRLTNQDLKGKSSQALKEESAKAIEKTDNKISHSAKQKQQANFKLFNPAEQIISQFTIFNKSEITSFSSVQNKLLTKDTSVFSQSLMKVNENNKVSIIQEQINALKNELYQLKLCEQDLIAKKKLQQSSFDSLYSILLQKKNYILEKSKNTLKQINQIKVTLQQQRQKQI